ncbi:MAG: preprotein translocase subunit YajC [Planctomycetes bacterium]|nr:preprotein translocase subunit YajC [Planctomycetota bacterium]MCH8210654.1 preprotein translocase subunit YajC [Planctomycetota bacterium]MCH8260097.1 preprotein translocase subunit YajC [Planctomycetota bacterium]
MFDINAQNLILAQDNQAPTGAGEEILPPLPGETTAGDGTTSVTGGSGGATGNGGGGLFNSGFMVVLVMMFLAMIIFSFMGQRRDRKKREAMISAVKKHDKVQTVGGLIGSVVEVKTDTIILKVDESANTRITFARSSIQQVITSATDGTSLEDGATG